MDDRWKDYEGKQVFIKLVSGRQYSGKVIKVDQSKHPTIFIIIIDKFGQKVMFSHSEVSVIEEEIKR